MHSEPHRSDKFKKTKSGKIVMLVISFAAMLALFISLLFLTPFFRLQTLEFTPNSQITKALLMEQMGVTQGKSVVFLLNNSKLEKALMQHPYIKKANIVKNIPSGLTLELEYREAFFTIYDTGFYILLDEALRVLSVDDMNTSAVRISGFKFKEFKIGQPIKVEAQKILERTVSLVKLMKISHLEFEDRIDFTGEDVIIFTADGIRGNFGDVSNVETKFNNFVEIFENLKQKGTISGLIDVSSEGLPTFKPFGD